MSTTTTHPRILACHLVPGDVITHPAAWDGLARVVTVTREGRDWVVLELSGGWLASYPAEYRMVELDPILDPGVSEELLVTTVPARSRATVVTTS